MSEDEAGDDEPGDGLDDEAYREFLKVQERTFEHQLPDPYLQYLAALAFAGFEISITLTLGGSTIAGQMVGPDRFMARLAENLENAAGEASAALAEAFREFAVSQQLAQVTSHIASDIVLDDAPIEYIHINMVNVVIWSGGLAIPVPAWRGRLVAIDGWCLGSAMPGPVAD